MTVALAREVRTTCGQCLAACGIVVGADGRIRGDGEHPISRGYVCRNGKASGALLGHAARLRAPLVRGHETRWAEAISAAARGLSAARDAGGPEAVGLYFGAGDPAGSVAFIASQAFLQSFGSTRHYNVVGLEATHRYVVAEALYGDPLLVPRPDVEHATSLLIVGANPAVSNDECGLATGLEEARRRHAVSVVLDPRRTEAARHATVHLALRPGTDAEVLLALLHVLFAERWVAPQPPIALDGVGRLRELAEAMPPERAAAVADVPAAEIVRAARVLGRARPTAVLTRLGIAMSRRATVNEWLCQSLSGVLGGLGARGGMVHNPGFVDFRGMLARTKVAAGSVLGILPPADLADAILDDGPGRIRALLVVAADPLESLPSTAKVRRALERLETLVVLDVVPTATTALASVVLPCAHHLEKEDVHLLLPDRVPRRYTQLSRRVVSPPGVSRSEVAILADLASALEMPLFSPPAIDVAVRVASRLIRAGERPVSPEGALEVLLPLATRFSLTRRGARAPSAGVRPAALDPRWLASGIRRRGGRIDLAPARFVEALEQALRGEPSEPSAEGHDLVLTTCARDRGFVNGKTRAIGRAANGLVASLCAADAERRGLADGARGWLETAVGSAEVTVKLDPDVREGLVVVPFGSPGLNALTDDRDRDPLSGIPALANVPCRLTSSGTRTEGVEA